MCYDGDQQLRLFLDSGEERHGYVYAGISHMRTAFKIGFTNRPPRRRGGELRTLQMLCWWPGDRFDEQRLHHELEAFRLAGNREWYEVRPDTVTFLIRRCREGDFPQGLRLLLDLAREHFPEIISVAA